jgi:hypothetical protein
LGGFAFSNVYPENVELVFVLHTVISLTIELLV